MDLDNASQSLSPAATSRRLVLRLPSTCEPPSLENPPKQASWIIFGATGHIGRSLVRAALAHGDQCTAVGWTQENTIEQMNKWQDKKCLGLLCDVRIRETVDEVIQKSVERWGNVDIIANCTGYGVIGSCEDQDDYDLRNQFSTNFLGTLHIIQLSLPHFRSQNHGRYLIFSSTAGALGVPGLGPYCATKYAVEGLIESMLYEVDIFNIKATLVEPGHVRLDEPYDGSIPTGASNNTTSGTSEAGPPLPKRYGHFWVKPSPSAPYATLTSPAGHAKRMVQWLNDRQPVSAVKSAELVWQLGHCSYPPLRLLLGSYAVESIRDRLRSIIEEIEDWKHLSFPITTTDDAPTSERGGEDQEEEDNQ
ncbi:short chain dehydrogenase/reductase family protein-like protein [Pleomassaria siparia CBS 279.74]|uniref:Short chain dehydrogenase/reductase family protein-like protein n=1 Tax=Pleomassaria siparia CBS 279.74 TaxID=1314801 RepID=A0A6G1KRK4_9PLEO|nr:short chain dehydrogenase/reductase family protein-like protein [Pleomassaria siparia CBS 279.74]